MLLQFRTLRRTMNENGPKQRPHVGRKNLEVSSARRPLLGPYGQKANRLKVFVLYNTLAPAMPCSAKRARQLLERGSAAVYRRVPFTIVLKHRSEGEAQPVTLKLDPGAKTTGIALVANDAVLFAINLTHRGAAIRKALEARRALRRSRRSRNTRYRAPRFNNRTRPKGWLPPSLQSRVDNVASWARRLLALAPIGSIDVETARFDMQKMQNAEISGVDYQQGELAGYEVREYLLEKFDRTCVYCDKQNVPLEVEHVTPRSRGGSDSISNLALACHACNQAKGDRDVRDFVKDTARLAKILANLKKPLKDAAAVNATRYAIGRTLKATGLPIAFWSGARTKMNRVAQGYAKDHWIDAACVGESGAAVRLSASTKALSIKAVGRGSRQMCRVDKYGFPRSVAKSVKRVDGFQTGDLVRLVQPTGKHQGTYVGSVAVRARGAFDLKRHGCVPITSPAKHFTLLQKTDGYIAA